MNADKTICRRCTAMTGQSAERFEYWWSIGLVWCQPQAGLGSGEWHNLDRPLTTRCKCYMENVVLGQPACGNDTKSAKAVSTTTTPCGV